MKYIVFIDVAGYTDAIRTQHKKTANLLETYDHIIGGKISSISGEVISRAGDGYYIQFPGDTDPIKVVRCLVGIIEALAEIKSYLAIRIGLHFANVDRGTERDININLTQRLETAAKPNQINISEDIYKFIKDKDHNLVISEDSANLKGLGSTKFYRTKILAEEQSAEYRKPQVDTNSLRDVTVEYDQFSARIVMDENKDVAMVEATYADGQKYYAEMRSDGTFVKLDMTTYQIMLLPNEDLLEKIERIEDDQIWVILKYKWSAEITLKYDMNRKLAGFNGKNVNTEIKNKEKEIKFSYKIAENPQKLDFRKQS